MLFTNTSRGERQRNGSIRARSCSVTPKPGPLVRGSPSRWYFGCPIRFSRTARSSA
jgi:hypothetical protein